MKNSRNIKKEIKSCYTKFFKNKEFDIDPENGVLKTKKEWKFATHPYIGSQYGKNTKILFIGLDIGEDERPGCITSFNERQEDIGNDTNYKNIKYNPHIAGTLVTATYFSNENKVREKIEKERNYKNAIKVLKKDNMENPLAYIALTNFYKFVTQKRHNRSGPENRKYVSSQSYTYEHELLYNEIKIFSPKIIIFQSVEFERLKYKDFLKELRNQNKTIEIRIGPHPACRPPYSRIPKEYLASIKEKK